LDKANIVFMIEISITMKKLVTIAIISLMVTAVYAQNSAVNKASKFKKNGHLMKAKEQIDLATTRGTTANSPKAWFTKGEVYESENPNYQSFQDDALHEAVAAYNKSKSLDGGGNYDGLSSIKIDNMWGTLINQGAEAYNQEDYNNAVVYFEKSSVMKPQDTTAYYYAGIAAQQGELYQQALDNYYKLIDLDYHSEDIYSSVVYLVRTHNNDNDKALEVLELAREHFPDNETLMKEEINLLIITEQTDKAKSKLTEAIKAEPDNANLYYNLAYISEQTGDDAAAVNYYNQAAYISEQTGDDEAAVNYYNQAEEISNGANKMDLRPNQKESKANEEKMEAFFKWKAKQDWPTDFQMQEYEINKQKEAFNKLRRLMSSQGGINTSDYELILGTSLSKWPLDDCPGQFKDLCYDYAMVVYEVERQIEAYKRINK